MIRKSGYRFSLATNAECVCAEIMLNQESKARWQFIPVPSRFGGRAFWRAAGSVAPDLRFSTEYGETVVYG
jgi:hypothetical protein